jgi:hypothetical protein
MNRLNVSRVTSMAKLFSHMDTFNEPIDAWDVSQVEDMSQMFYRARAFNQPLATWTPRQVVWMSGMFAYAESFNQPVPWPARQVVTTYDMFRKANRFNQPIFALPPSLRCVAYMFQDATSFNQPLRGEFQQIQNATHLFARATSFNQPMDWHLRRCDIEYMFLDALSFNQPLHRLFASTTQVVPRQRGFSQGAIRMCRTHLPTMLRGHDNTVAALRAALGLDGRTSPPRVLPLSTFSAFLFSTDLRWEVAEWLAWPTPDEWLLAVVTTQSCPASSGNSCPTGEAASI